MFGWLFRRRPCEPPEGWMVRAAWQEIGLGRWSIILYEWDTLLSPDTEGQCRMVTVSERGSLEECYEVARERIAKRDYQWIVSPVEMHSFAPDTEESDT